MIQTPPIRFEFQFVGWINSLPMCQEWSMWGRLCMVLLDGTWWHLLFQLNVILCTTVQHQDVSTSKAFSWAAISFCSGCRVRDRASDCGRTPSQGASIESCRCTFSLFWLFIIFKLIQFVTSTHVYSIGSVYVGCISARDFQRDLSMRWMP